MDFACCGRWAGCLVGLLVVWSSPATAESCTGDCDGDGRVRINEIVRSVDIALGVRRLTDCTVSDRDGSGDVEIGELIAAVAFASLRCPVSEPTATATAEATPSSTDTPIVPSSTPTDLPSASPTPTHTPASQTPTETAGSTCVARDPPVSYGEGFVDLTTGIEKDLVPVIERHPDVALGKVVAVLSDTDGDGTMETYVGQDSGNSPAPIAVLRYDPATRKLARDFTVSLPSFDEFFGVIDVDSDGIADLFGQSHARPRVAWGRGGGIFDELADVFPEPEPLTFYHGPYFDDFDRDGWLDFIVDGNAACGERSVRVLFAEGNRRWSRRLDIPSNVRIGDGVYFTAPLAGIEHTAAVLGFPCGEVDQSARFFVPAPGAGGLPTWTPADIIETYVGPLDDPLGAPMGAAVGDLDGDGRFELAISGDPVLGMWGGADAPPLPDITHETNMTLKNSDRGVPQIPWAVLFIDLDRDGRLDTFVTHGDDYFSQATQSIGKQWSTAYWNAGALQGCEISEALNITRRGNWRTLSVGDLEADGLPDLAVGGLGEQPRILHNRIDSPNRGFGLRLRGTTSNPYGIGARVEVDAAPGSPTQLHLVGGFYPPAIAVEPLVFIGLGSAPAAERVRITWPSGTIQDLHDVRAGALHTIVEPPVVTVEPASRHLRADSDDVATIHVTPRDAAGAVRTDATVDVAIRTGDATLRAPAAWNGSEWLVEIVAPEWAGSSVIEISVDGTPLGIRPRIWFD